MPRRYGTCRTSPIRNAVAGSRLERAPAISKMRNPCNRGVSVVLTPVPPLIPTRRSAGLVDYDSDARMVACRRPVVDSCAVRRGRADIAGPSAPSRVPLPVVTLSPSPLRRNPAAVLSSRITMRYAPASNSQDRSTVGGSERGIAGARDQRRGCVSGLQDGARPLFGKRSQEVV